MFTILICKFARLCLILLEKFGFLHLLDVSCWQFCKRNHLSIRISRCVQFISNNMNKKFCKFCRWCNVERMNLNPQTKITALEKFSVSLYGSQHLNPCDVNNFWINAPGTAIFYAKNYSWCAWCMYDCASMLLRWKICYLHAKHIQACYGKLRLLIP